VKKWCPSCKVIVIEPSTYELTKYAKFWRDNRCFRCETQLSSLPSAERSALKDLPKPKPIIKCPRCEYTFEEPDIMSPSAAWVYYQQGLCPRCRESLAAQPKPEERERYISKSVRVTVWQRDGGKCVECGSCESLEYDHIIPFSKGGSNTERNIQLLCAKCNREKANNVA